VLSSFFGRFSIYWPRSIFKLFPRPYGSKVMLPFFRCTNSVTLGGFSCVRHWNILRPISEIAMFSLVFFCRNTLFTHAPMLLGPAVRYYKQFQIAIAFLGASFRKPACCWSFLIWKGCIVRCFKHDLETFSALFQYFNQCSGSKKNPNAMFFRSIWTRWYWT